MFDFERGTDGVIFALLVSVGVLFFLYLRAQTTADTNERSIRLLVEALGQERFDWERAEGLPDGPRLVTICPAYNEGENVAAVIKQIPSMIEGHHVVPVVVSDGSTDGTATVARDAGAYVAELPIGGAAGWLSASGTRSRSGWAPSRRHARLRRPAPARGDPDRDPADRRERGRLRERLEAPRLVRAGEPRATPRGPRLLPDRHDPHGSQDRRSLLRLSRGSGGPPGAGRVEAGPVLVHGDPDRGAAHPGARRRGPGDVPRAGGGESKKPKSLRYGWNFLKVIIQTWLR